MRLADIVDAVVEAPVVPSFTRVGYDLRSRLDHWRSLDEYRLDDKVVVLTGATSGLGLAAAEQFARCGATLVLVGRSPEKCDRVCTDLQRRTGSHRLETVVADMAEPDQVRGAAQLVSARYPVVHALVHNAGALSARRTENSHGVETTVAAQVLGPFLLTSLLLDNLRQARPGRVITMSSGGMYAASLEVEHLQMGADYRGAEQYARAKRAQVALNAEWATRVPATDVVFHAVHPGWADTPGVETSLPRFRRVVGPLLRSPLQGADTMVWLAADDGPPAWQSGRFWLDRRVRSEHRVPTTRRSDTAARRRQLWEWCVAATGAHPLGDTPAR